MFIQYQNLGGKFTFYYIYIKTTTRRDVLKAIAHLHSTIFILKHNIINQIKIALNHLHSTIFILKLSSRLTCPVEVKFTFYYIYIKTKNDY